ncbi:MAG: hypothetical protein U7127_00260 [Phormidium sp.]|uniref:LAGLIDADG homing endonuclease n=1 Tax=Floridaenema flaviceps BLCC-F50 TaxID=3153642 RepID=A0ABV4Y2M6_9CYAN
MLELYDLLGKIKQRPSLYLGKRSLSHLHVFLDGYSFACRQIGIPVTEQEKDFEEFQEWIEHRFNQANTQSWSRIILFYAEDEADALNRFFELFEDFLQRKKLPKGEEITNLEMPDEVRIVAGNS